MIARFELECSCGYIFTHCLERFDGYIRSMSVYCPRCARLSHCAILGVSYV